MERILIVDASPLIYAVYDTQGHLATKAGVPTGLRYGFLRSVRSYSEKVKADKIVIVFDTKAPVVKSEGREAEYKANRTWTESKATMYSQVPDLKQMLALTKWTSMEADGYEADDLIGALARAKSQRGDVCIIVSPDNDLAQLLSERVQIFVPGKSREKTKDHYKTPEDVFRDFGVWPEQLLVYRAICGDVSDNIAGIGLEKSQCAQIANAFVRLPRKLLSAEAFFEVVVPLLSEELQRVFAQGTPFRYAFDQNYHLMSLHRPPNELLKVTKGAADPQAMEDLFKSLEFNSMFKFIGEYTGKPYAAPQ